MADDLVIRVRDELDHVVLRLSGFLTLRSVSRLREVTVEWLQGTGSVLIDVSRVRVSKAAMVTVFPTALGLAGGWPAARLVECGHLIWPRLVRFSSSVLAPPSGVVAADGGVSSPVLAPPLSE